MKDERQRTEHRHVVAERSVVASQERGAHEVDCPGYSVQVNDAQRTVYVGYCNRGFGRDYPDLRDSEIREWFVYCRKGDDLRKADPKFCERRLTEELARRPGWRTELAAIQEASRLKNQESMTAEKPSPNSC